MTNDVNPLHLDYYPVVFPLSLSPLTPHALDLITKNSGLASISQIFPYFIMLLDRMSRQAGKGQLFFILISKLGTFPVQKSLVMLNTGIYFLGGKWSRGESRFQCRKYFCVAYKGLILSFKFSEEAAASL